MSAADQDARSHLEGPAIAASSAERPVVDELRDALICLLAVVDLADCNAGIDEDLHQLAKDKARAALRRVPSERPIVGPGAMT